MQSKQRHSSTQQSRVPLIPTTLWHRLPTGSQQQLAHLVAAQDKESDHER